VVSPDAGPLAAFTATPAQTGSATAFVSQATDSDEAITTQSWSFGDGSSATGALVTHTYTSPGTYTVTLTDTDAADCSSTSPFFSNEAGPFTGTLSACSPDAAATTSQTVTIPADQTVTTPTPAPTPTLGPGHVTIGKVTITAPKLTSVVTCRGGADQTCAGTLYHRAREHRTGSKITAVTASRQPKKPKKTTRTVTLGHATYKLTGGRSKTLTITSTALVRAC
jgi:PKD repeat protein